MKPIAVLPVQWSLLSHVSDVSEFFRRPLSQPPHSSEQVPAVESRWPESVVPERTDLIFQSVFSGPGQFVARKMLFLKLSNILSCNTETITQSSTQIAPQWLSHEWCEQSPPGPRSQTNSSRLQKSKVHLPAQSIDILAPARRMRSSQNVWRTTQQITSTLWCISKGRLGAKNSTLSRSCLYMLLNCLVFRLLLYLRDTLLQALHEVYSKHMQSPCQNVLCFYGVETKNEPWESQTTIFFCLLSRNSFGFANGTQNSLWPGSWQWCDVPQFLWVSPAKQLHSQVTRDGAVRRDTNRSWLLHDILHSNLLTESSKLNREIIICKGRGDKSQSFEGSL